MNEHRTALLDEYAAASGWLTRTSGVLDVPGPDRWSAAGHFYHADLVNRGMLVALHGIAQQPASGLAAAANPLAERFLGSGHLPRGFKAPDAMHPPETFSLDALLDRMARTHARLEALDVEALAPLTGTMPHPRLGPLTAPDWLRFGVVHMRHHAALARETVA